MPRMQPLTDHERVRRELWADIYRQEHERKTFWVHCEERADQAVRAFDKRFGADGVSGTDHHTFPRDTPPPGGEG